MLSRLMLTPFSLSLSLARAHFLSLSPSLAPAEESVSCENPGLPDNGYQILSKRLYLPSESLTFICYQGFELIGEVAIKCILGNPSFWSGPLPLCRGEAQPPSTHTPPPQTCMEWNIPHHDFPHRHATCEWCLFK